MATTINTSVFSPSLQSNPNFNTWITQFQNSPTLVSTLNTLYANGGTIQLGQAGAGTSTVGKTISLDPNVVTAFQAGSSNQLQLGVIIGHELGHAVMPNGENSVLQPGTNTPTQGAQIGLNDEGVALENEYKVATELGTNMYSGGSNSGTLKTQLSNLAQQDGLNTTKFDTDAIAAGAQFTSTLSPSTAPNLNYQQYYQDKWIVGTCSDLDTANNPKVDWLNTKPGDIQFTNNGSSCAINMNSVKLQGGATATVTGTTSDSNGKPISTEETIQAANGNTEETLNDTGSSSTKVNFDYDGNQSYTKDTTTYTGLNATGNKIEDVDDSKYYGICIDTKYDFDGNQSYTKDANYWTGADDTGGHISDVLDTKFYGWSVQTQFDYNGQQSFTKDTTTWAAADATGAKIEDVSNTKAYGVCIDTNYDWTGQFSYTKNTNYYSGSDKTGALMENIDDTKFYGICVDTKNDWNGQQNYTKDTQWYTGADKTGSLMGDRDDTKFYGICTDTHYDWNNTDIMSKSIDFWTGADDTGSRFQTTTDYDFGWSDLLQYDWQNNQWWATNATEYLGQDLTGTKMLQIYDWHWGASTIDSYDIYNNQAWRQIDYNYSKVDGTGNETSRTVDWDNGSSTLYTYSNGIWDVYNYTGADDSGTGTFAGGYYGSDTVGSGYVYDEGNDPDSYESDDQQYDKVNQSTPKIRNGIDQISVYDNATGQMHTIDLTKALNSQNSASIANQSAAAVGKNKISSPAYQANIGEGATWNHKTITWSFADHNSSDQSGSPFSGFIQAQYQTDIEQAVQTWAQASGLTFQQVSDSQQADIRIGWGDLNTATTDTIGLTDLKTNHTQLNSGVIVRLEDPSQLALTQNAQRQYVYSGTDATLNQVALHELGHALGLGVDEDPNSIMYSNSTSANRTLDETDIAGIQSLYDYSSLVSQAPSANDDLSASSINVNGYQFSENDLMLATAAAR